MEVRYNCEFVFFFMFRGIKFLIRWDFDVIFFWLYFKKRLDFEDVYFSGLS